MDATIVQGAQLPIWFCWEDGQETQLLMRIHLQSLLVQTCNYLNKHFLAEARPAVKCPLPRGDSLILMSFYKLCFYWSMSSLPTRCEQIA